MMTTPTVPQPPLPVYRVDIYRAGHLVRDVKVLALNPFTAELRATCLLRSGESLRASTPERV